MKTVSLIFMIVAAPFILRAQETTTPSNYPHWAIAKDVHRFKYLNVPYAPPEIEIIDISALVSKNIHRKPRSSKGFVAFGGYPSWTISKPVARPRSKKTDSKD